MPWSSWSSGGGGGGAPGPPCMPGGGGPWGPGGGGGELPGAAWHTTTRPRRQSASTGPSLNMFLSLFFCNFGERTNWQAPNTTLPRARLIYVRVCVRVCVDELWTHLSAGRANVGPRQCLLAPDERPQVGQQCSMSKHSRMLVHCLHVCSSPSAHTHAPTCLGPLSEQPPVDLNDATGGRRPHSS